MRSVHCLAVAVLALVLNAPEAVPVPQQANELVELGESPASAMIAAINAQVHAAQKTAEKQVDSTMGLHPVHREIDDTIHKLAVLRGMGKKQETSHSDMGEGAGASAVEAAMAKAAAKAKVMRALRKARASLAKAQRGGKKATKAATHVGHFRDASISDMKTLVSASVKAEMAKANVVATEDPLDKEIDQISVVRAREKAKDQVKQQLAQAAESMDLAESNDETPKHQPPTMSWIQLGMGSGMPAAKPPPPSPPNVPVADVKKDIPAKKALARATPKAPAGGAAMDSALKAAKPAKSPISTKKLPPKPGDPNFSQADIDSAVKKISEFPMTDKDATKEGEKNQKSWDDKKKPKSRKATGPAMKKQNPLAKGSGSGKKKKE